MLGGIFHGMEHHSHWRSHKITHRYESLAPEIAFNSSGTVKSMELFGDYVTRQLGLRKGSAIARRLAEVAKDYLAGDKSSSDHSLEGILVFLSKIGADPDDEAVMLDLHREIVRELDACMISYFAFHWHHASQLLDQVRDGHSGPGMRRNSLRHAVLAATRKERFQKIMAGLRAKRTISTLLETLKAMGSISKDSRVPREGEVVVPAESKHRSPVLLFIGGGMGAGKSTVVKEILAGSFWSGVVQDTVVVEADAFKETDVVYRTISSSERGDGGDIAMASELVHSSSTMAASSLLVSALNDGRDVIFDGTMSWEPFVAQTIAMARDVHNRRYRMGPGYVKSEDGTVVEEYWVPVDPEEEEQGQKQDQGQELKNFEEQERELDLEKRELGNASSEKFARKSRRPYRIELVGVTCEPVLAVERGIRRAIITKRAVPIKGQLRSHKLFAGSLEKYCELVDNAKIYTTNKVGEPAELIGWKDDLSRCSKLLVDPAAFQSVKKLAGINENAGSILELFAGSRDDPSDDLAASAWSGIIFSPERASRQDRLRRLLASVKDTALESSPDSSSHGSS
ncbi:uncharacterized protein LOC9631455 [Selaginella moellendorffii]|uniref:uncharacterized protein LOC9631455 n=1 Tax=Selaginella moellendorffii TaxID=88036 RepID=UPI000D1CCDE3|nr:uncharacterized protein LOC9631455 [Selaginella moellendorffii]|eukprot:XP_024528801.1 uncharacterized protein LOC9631455 [Selaginella moellendorffii]